MNLGLKHFLLNSCVMFTLAFLDIAESEENLNIPLIIKPKNVSKVTQLVESKDFFELLNPSDEYCWIYCFCYTEKCFGFSCSYISKLTPTILLGDDENFFIGGEISTVSSHLMKCERFSVIVANRGREIVNKSLEVWAECYVENKRNIPIEIELKKNKNSTRSSSTPFSDNPTTSCEVLDDGVVTLADTKPIIVPVKNGKLDYPVVLDGENMKKSSLDHGNVNVLFNWFSTLVGYVQPDSFPLDFVKDAVKEDLPLRLLIFQVVRVEGVVLAWLFIWLIFAFSFPSAIITKVCCENKSLTKLEENSSVFSSNNRQDFGRHLVAVVYHFLLVLFFAFVALMLASNEKISKSAVTAPQDTVSLLQDIENFIKDTEIQYSFIISSSWEITTTKILEHLSEIDEYLGKPLQKKIDEETNVISSINNLTTLVSASMEISMKLKGLIHDCESAQHIRQNLQRELDIIFKDLTNIIRKCTRQDEGLCDTLISNNIEVVFDTNEIMSDVRLKHLEALVEENNFKRRVEGIRQSFESIPKRVRLDTTAYRSEIANMIRKRKAAAYKSTQDLEYFSEKLRKKISGSTKIAAETTETIASKDIWRWFGVIVISLILCVIWCLYICGAPCGCEASKRTIILLTSGLTLSCFLSLFLWAAGSVFFLLGGHGRTLICRTLYDEQQYKTLGDFLNSGGLFYRNRGFFNDFLDNDINEIRVEDVLRNCQNNQTVYTTFFLEDIVSVEKVGNYNRWPDLINYLPQISVDLSKTDFLPSSLEQHLEELQLSASINVTRYRTQSFGPLTNKDLNTFLDQLVSVSKQISDPTTMENLQTLTFSLKRVISTDLLPLRKIQDAVVFKLTELEVLLTPLRLNVNKSLVNLRNTAIFAKTHGAIISKEMSKKYTDDLEAYLDQMYNNIKSNILINKGKCGPLWEIYDTARIKICHSIIASMNTLSISCYILIIILIFFSPIILKVVAYCKKDIEDRNGQRSRYLSSEQRSWGTPVRTQRSRSRGTPEVEAVEPVQQTLWSTPSSSMPRPPPRPPTPKMDSPDTVKVEIEPSSSRDKPTTIVKRSRSRYDSVAQAQSSARQFQVSATRRWT